MLTDKNPNEKFYVHGKKHFSDVLKNSGPSDCLVWRQPEEDFNNNSVLIVNPGEKAVLLKDGDIVCVFSSGKYILNTENYPYISRLRNAFTGGVSVYNCVVYFVRDRESEEIKWGTNSPLQVRDKKWNILVEVGSRGSYKYYISNPEQFLKKIIGTNTNIENQNVLDQYFYEEFSSIIKQNLTIFLNNNINDELIGLNSFLTELSNDLLCRVNASVEEYGVTIKKFVISSIDVETSKYDSIDDSQIKRIEIQRDTLAKKDVRDILGSDFKEQQVIDIYKSAASNTGVAGMIAGIGLGDNLHTIFKEKTDDVYEKLKKAKKLLDDNLITEDDYNRLKTRLLNNL